MERERTMRRVLSMLLAVLMLVTSVPMDTVYAEELTNTGIPTVAKDNLEEQKTREGGEPVTQASVAPTASVAVDVSSSGFTNASATTTETSWDGTADLVYTLTSSDSTPDFTSTVVEVDVDGETKLIKPETDSDTSVTTITIPADTFSNVTNGTVGLKLISLYDIPTNDSVSISGVKVDTLTITPANGEADTFDGKLKHGSNVDVSITVSATDADKYISAVTLNSTPLTTTDYEVWTATDFAVNKDFEFTATTASKIEVSLADPAFETNADVDININDGTDAVKIIPGEEVTVSAKVQLNATGTEANKKIDKVEFVDSNANTVLATLTDAKGDGNYTGNIEATITTGWSSAVTGKLTVTTSKKQTATVTMPADVTVDKDLPAISKDAFVLYKSNDGGKTYAPVNPTSATFYVGDKLAIGLENEVEYATLTVANNTSSNLTKGQITLAGEGDATTSVNAYTFDAAAGAGENTITVTATLSKDVIIFETGNYTVEYDGKQIANPSKEAVIYIVADSNKFKSATIKPAAGYKLSSVTKGGNAEQNVDYDSHELSFTLGSNKVTKVSVETAEGYSLNITKDDNITGFYDDLAVANNDNNGSSAKTSFLLEDGKVTVFVKLASADYKLNSLKLTAGKTVTELVNTNKVTQAEYGSPDDATIFKVVVDASADATLNATTVKKAGEKVSFAGDHFKAYVVAKDTKYNDASDTAYSKELPFVDDLASNEKDIYLVAEDGYRFTEVSSDFDSENVKFGNGGKTVKITGLKKSLFNDDNKELTVSASLESVVALTIPISADYTVEVEESTYDYHYGATGADYTGTASNIVKPEQDGITYLVSPSNEVTVKVTPKNNDTHKVSSIIQKTEGAAEKDITSDINVEDYVYVVSITANKATELAIEVSADASKLPGIKFAKGQYAVEDSNSKKIVEVEDFLNEDGTQNDSFLYLFESLQQNDTNVTLKVSPAAGYSIDTITYDGEECFDAEDTTKYSSVTGDITSTESSGIITLTIPVSKLDKTGDQKLLEVSTSATGLDNALVFGVDYAEKQYVEVDKIKTDKLFFDPEEELNYTVKVDGSVADEDDSTGKYTAAANKKQISITVDPVLNVDPKISFLNSQDKEIEGILVARSGNTFTVSASALAEKDANGVTIVVDGTVKTENISFTYNENLVTVDMTRVAADDEDADDTYTKRSPYASLTVEPRKDADGKALTDGSVVATYAVRKGETAEVSVKVKHDGERYFAELTRVGTEAFDSYEAGFNVTAAAEKEIAIETKALTSHVLEYKNNPLLAEEDGSYVISYKTDYTAYYYDGADVAEVNKAEFLVDGAERTVTVSKNKVSFRVNKEDAGKTAVLKLQKKDSEDNVVDVTSFRFVIAELLTGDGLVVSGVVNGVLEQMVDTKASYEVTIPEGTIINDLDASATTGGVAAMVDGKLVVTTSTQAAKDAAFTVSLINKKNGSTLQKFTVKTTEVPGLEDAKLGVTAVASSTKALNMVLSASGVADVDLNAGEIAYKVVVKAQKGSTSPTQTTFYVKKTGETTPASLEILAKEVSKGKESKYDVTVQLVRLAKDLDADNVTVEAKDEIFKSKEVVKKEGTDEFVVKPPYYASADELSLENTVGVIYRGETKVIADVNFGEKTSFVDATAALLDAKGNAVSGGYTATVAYNKLTLKVTSDLNLGTYTVVVTAKNPDSKNVLPITKSMSIKVEEGVWSVDILNAPDTLLKLDNKDAKLKVTAVLNGGVTNGIKNKKVTWELFKSVEKLDNGDYKLNPITEKDALYGKITINNGNIVVNKSYPVSATASNNRFVVVATSEANPTVWNYAEVEITQKEAELGELVLVKATEFDPATNLPTKFAKVEQDNVSSDLASSENFYMISVKKGLSSKTTFTADNMTTVKVALKVSNKKLAVTEVELTNTKGEAVCAYQLQSSTTLKNVKITLSSLDGSKKSVQKAFNVVFASMDNLVMKIEGNIVNGTYKFAGTSEDTLVVVLGSKNAKGEFVPFSGVLNAKVAIKGGKILSSDLVNNEYVIKVNKEEASFSVTDKATKAVTTCDITNTSYTTAAAPNVIADVKDIAANSVFAQEIKYSLKTTGKQKAADYKFVKIQIDTTDELKLQKKNKDGSKYTIYTNFKEATGLATDGFIISPITNGGFTLKFAGEENGAYAISTGAYKLFFTYGDYDKAGNFIPATKAGKATVKAIEAKSMEYYVDSEYTMSLLDSAAVELTGTEGKNKGAQVTYLKAWSTVENGAANAFGTFFEVKDGKLALKPYTSLDDKQVKSLEKLVGDASAADLTGYVTYRVNGSAAVQKARVHVTLSKEALKKYEASKITMLAGDKVKPTVSITTDGEAVKAVAAVVTSGSFDKNVTIAEDGNLVLQSKNISAGTSTATVSVVPSTSFYAAKDKVEANKYGVAVNVNVDAKSTANPVIKIGDLNVKFDQYDGVDKKYIATIPYTSEIANKITSITIVDKDLKNSKAIEFSANDNNEIIVKVDKAKLELEKPVVTYGDNKNIEVIVEFCKTVKENYTFAVTFPSRPSVATEDLQAIFTKIREAVWNYPKKDAPAGTSFEIFPTAVDFAEADALRAKADEQYQAEEKAATATVLVDHTASKKLYGEAQAKYISIAEEAVKAAVEKALVLGADIKAVSVVGSTTNTIAKPFDNIGNIDVNITLKGAAVTADNVNQSVTPDYTIATKVPVKGTTDLLKLYTDRLNTFASDLAKNGYVDDLYVNNSLTEESFLSAVRSYVGVEGSYRIVVVKEHEWNMTQATSLKAGKYAITLQVIDKDRVGEEGKGTPVPFKGTIKKLDDVSAVEATFRQFYDDFKTGTLEGFEFTNLNIETSSTMIEQLAAAAIARHNNSNIQFSYVTDNEFAQTEDATGKVTGVAGKLVFTETIGEDTMTSSDISLAHKFANSGCNLTNLKSVVDAAVGKNLSGDLDNSYDSNVSILNGLVADALDDAPYRFTLTVGENDWQAPTYKEDGFLKYNIRFEALDGVDDTTAEDVEAATLTYFQTLPANVNYMTFAEAVAAVKEGFVKIKEDTAISGWFKSNGSSYPNSSDLDLDVVETVIQGFISGSAFSVDYDMVVDKFFTKYIPNHEYEAATVNDGGSLTVTVIVSGKENGEDVSEEVTLRKNFSKLEQTDAEVQAVINNLSSKITVNSSTTEDTLLRMLNELIDTNVYTATIAGFKNENKAVKCNITVKKSDIVVVNAQSVSLSYK